MTIGKSQEDYLEAILVLNNCGGPVRSVDVARQLRISKASVCTMVSALVEEGLVRKTEKPPYRLSLTETGLHIAEQTYARHCFFREMLLGAGVDAETAEREACELEHDISPESFRLLQGASERCTG